MSTHEITRPGFTPYYSTVPCRVWSRRHLAVNPSYVDVDLLRDPGFGSMFQPRTALGNVEWRPDDGGPAERVREVDDRFAVTS